mmetsp:Transcript_22003/g.34159  ORF Transcript_22003/g.34159 Transcript_22003/m.34159 type:complete len:292 (+) Transcript_22003:289-1164(+)
MQRFSVTNNEPKKPDDKQDEVRKLSKINLTVHNIEQSKYDGQPLIKPKTPYQFKVKTYEPDKSLSFSKRTGQRLSFLQNSAVEYGKDIWGLRYDAVAYKTAEFYKRNFNRIRVTMSHVAYEARKIKQGFISLKNDVKYYMGVEKKKINTKYKADNFMEETKVRQIRKDVFKFIPFSIFLLIPGGEILLPPYLVVFPNSIPSQFLSEEARNKKFREIAKSREKAASKLNILLPHYLYNLESDSQIHESDLADIKKLKADMKKTEVLPTDLLHYKRLFKRYADFNFFDLHFLK